LIALHGDGSGIIFEVDGFTGITGVAIGDVDADGMPEVIGTLYEEDDWVGYVVALSNEGHVEWTSDILWGDDPWSFLAQPSIADLDGDGAPEVITNFGILNGSDGTLLARFYEAPTGEDRPLAIADIDGDGLSEALIGEQVFDHEGGLLWSSTHYGEGYFPWVTSLAADFDADPYGEVVFFSTTIMSVLDQDGSLLGEYEALESNALIPCLADFDGDSDIEVAVPTGDTLYMVETDGTVGWQVPVDDGTGLAGCSGFDFDGDGAYEVLHADQFDFRILDGATGAVRFLWSDHDSNTLFEYPVVADVDHDGSAEIVVACNEAAPNQGLGGDCRGIYVLGHADSEWPPAGPYWGIHDYAPLRIRPDGEVQSPTPAWWNSYNMFRARPPGDGSPDLYAVQGESCIASCESGPVKVSWGIGNQGHINVLDTISVALYGDVGGTETLLEVQVVSGAQYGYQAPGGTFELTPDQWGDGIRIVVDDDGTGVGSVEECDEGNNVLEILGPICE